MSNNNSFNRRDFMKSTVKTGVATGIASLGFPTIVPAHVMGKDAPSNKINIGAIGVGRISRDHDMAETLKYDHARIMAVCDVDAKRLADGKKYVNDFYTKKTGKAYTAFSHRPQA